MPEMTTTIMKPKMKPKAKRRFVMRPVDSSMITHIGYFSVGLLVIRFKSGDVWCYRGVERGMWLSLCHVRSKGQWFNRRVRGKLEGTKLGPELAGKVMEHCLVKSELVQ